MKRKLLLLSLVVFLLGCGEEEIVLPEPVYVPPPLHTQMDRITWDSHLFENITPVTSYEESGDSLKVFPYFNGDFYILIEKIYLSDNKFWDSVISDYIGTPNGVDYDEFSLFTTGQGVTLGLVMADDGSGYLVRTDNLSSAYVKRVCEVLCQ